MIYLTHHLIFRAMETNYLMIFCTVPDTKSAESIASALVSEQLAACCNIIQNVRSVYSWKNEICDDTELLLVIKTTVDAYDNLEAKITELHPYEVPEILAIPIYRGSKDYLNWVDSNVNIG